MSKKLTCIVCPMGCELNIELVNNKVKSVTGNTCPRGKKYAIDEFTNPMRTITTTIKCDNGAVVPVKTDKAIHKNKMFECMQIINSNLAHLPISVGDVIIKDVFGSNVVATTNME